MSRKPRVVMVEVSAEDIARGLRAVKNTCPLALALHRAGYDHAAVDVEEWEWQPGRWAPLSLRAQRFVADFDEGIDVAPTRFQLQVPR